MALRSPQHAPVSHSEHKAEASLERSKDRAGPPWPLESACCRTRPDISTSWWAAVTSFLRLSGCTWAGLGQCGKCPPDSLGGRSADLRHPHLLVSLPLKGPQGSRHGSGLRVHVRTRVCIGCDGNVLSVPSNPVVTSHTCLLST